MNEKFILHSKTFLGFLLPILTTYLPMVGVPFGVDESQLVLTTFDAAMIAIGGAISLYGMIVSKTIKSLKPVVAKGEPKPTFISEVLR